VSQLGELLVGRCTSEYLLEALAGRGGMGVVYRARDLGLQRTVAVKLLNPPADAEPDEPPSPSPGSPLPAEVEARFFREALITARLQHPAIVPVYQGGRWPTGEPFYTMRLMSGRSFKEVVAGARDLTARLALLPHLVAVAEAIAYAHSEGVIHRDLKPSNILLGHFGETVVADWGLAKDLRAPDADEPRDDAPPVAAGADHTTRGAVLGTPAYMAPEQARGQIVDERADVYALGALAYFMVAGGPPYQEDAPGAVLRQVLAGPPPSLSTRQPNVPAELLAIVHKAMARDPAARYANAGELAADLKRLQTGQLVGAQQYSAWSLVARWARRHRPVLLTASALVVALLVTAGLSVWRIARERSAAERQAHALILSRARASLTSDPTTALAWLKRYPRNGAEWSTARSIALEAVSAGVASDVFARDLSQTVGSFSPDGARYVTTAAGRRLDVVRVADGHVIASLPDAGDVWNARLIGDAVWFVRGSRNELRRWRLGERDSRVIGRHDAMIIDFDVSADGARAATAGDVTVRVWEVAGAPPRIFAGHRGRVTAVRLTRDGRTVFSTGSDGTLRQWSVDSGDGSVLDSAGADLVALALSRDERVIATAVRDGTVRFVARGGVRGAYRAHDAHGINALAVSSDGRFIASAGEDKRVALYDRRAGTLASLTPHTAPCDAVSFSPDGKRLASAGRDGNVVVRELGSGSERVLRGHVFTTLVEFSPDGRHLASTGSDRATRLWDLGSDAPELLGSAGDRVWGQAFAPDGSSLATVAADGEVRLWRDGTSRVLGKHDGFTAAVEYSSDGAWLATASVAAADGGRLWDLVHGGSRVVGSGPMFGLAFSPDGTLLAFAGADGNVYLVAPASGEVRALRGHRGPVDSVRFSRDGALLASGGSDGAVRLWRRDGTPMRLLGYQGDVHLLRFTPDGATLIAAGFDRTLRRWRLADGSFTALPAPSFPLVTLELSPDGGWLAGAGQGPFVRMWHLGTTETRDLYGHADQIRAISFTPDGTLMATGSFDRTVRVWSVATGLLVAILQHGSCVMDCTFSPSGETLLVPTADRSLVAWHAPFDRDVPVAPDAIAAWLARVTRAEVEPLEHGPR
jgi:WD40 repeat protein